jgi:hypothetical protein
MSIVASKFTVSGVEVRGFMIVEEHPDPNLLRKLAEGAKIQDLLDAHPKLAVDDIRAAVDYTS